MNTFVFLRKCKNSQIDADVDRTLEELSKHNYATTRNSGVARYLGKALKEQKRQNLIYFSHNEEANENRQSVIHIPHDYQLIRYDKRRLKWVIRDSHNR